MEEIAFKKEKILKLSNEKTDSLRKYREFHRIYEQKSKEYDQEIQDLLKILPTKI